MATFESGWVATDDWKVRLIANVVDINNSQSRVDCTLQIVSQYGSGNWETTSTIWCDGQSATVGHHGFGAWTTTTMQTASFIVPRGNGSGRNVGVAGGFRFVGSSIGSYNNGATASGSVWVSSRVYSKPHKPRNPGLARSSDSAQVIWWEADYTGYDGDFPWNGIYVDRSTDDGPWTNIATLSWSALNYTDGTTSANHKYAYRVFSYGPGGVSDESICGTTYTTPAAPASIVASKASESSVTLTINGPAPYATGYKVQRSADGGKTWADITGTAGGTAQAPTFTDPAAPAGTVIYQVRSFRGDLSSAWVRSSAITTITPPLAPAVDVDEKAISVGSSVTVYWTPNHPDGSGQTAAQVHVICDYDSGSFEETKTVTGNATDLAYTPKETGTVSFRVRTKGLDPDWGAWSSAVAVSVAVPPKVFFTNPATEGAVVDSLPLDLAWSVTDKTGVSAQFISIAKGDAPDLSTLKEISKDARSYRLTSSMGIENGSSYTAIIMVRGGSGLVDYMARTFRTRWTPPAKPIITVEYDESYSAQITVQAQNGGSEPETTALDLSISLPDGTRYGTGLSNGTILSYRYSLPPLNTPFDLIAVARAESGATSTETASATLDSGGMEVYNFGVSAQRVHALGLEAQASDSVSHSGETFHFALGSGTPNMPTFYPDGDIDPTGKRTYTVIGQDGYKEMRDESRRSDSALCWFRDYYGGRHFGHAEISTSYDAGRYDLFEIGVDFTETVWEEPQNG